MPHVTTETEAAAWKQKHCFTTDVVKNYCNISAIAQCEANAETKIKTKKKKNVFRFSYVIPFPRSLSLSLSLSYTHTHQKLLIFSTLRNQQLKDENLQQFYGEGIQILPRVMMTGNI